MNDRERFLEASALSAVGRLEAQEAAWMAQQLQLHPEWSADVRAQAGVAAGVREVLAQDARTAPTLSFEDALALLPAIPARRVERALPPAPPRWLQSLHRWWQRPAAMGLALAGVAVLAVGLAVQTRRLDDAGRRLVAASDTAPVGPTYRGAASEDRAALTLRLDPSMPLGDAIQLLRQQNLMVVEGPNADGVFLVLTPASGADAKTAALRQMPQVLSVQRVAGGS